MKHLNTSYLNTLLTLEIFSDVESQLRNPEVLISVYGDSNVGKSTLINSIIGDRYNITGANPAVLIN